ALAHAGVHPHRQRQARACELRRIRQLVGVDDVWRRGVSPRAHEKMRSLAAAVLMAALGCHREAVPARILIPVEIDGQPARPIDSARLRATPPDAGVPAWRLRRLLGSAYARPDTILEVEDERGLRSVFLRPAEQIDGRELALALDPRGAPVVMWLGSSS